MKRDSAGVGREGTVRVCKRDKMPSPTNSSSDFSHWIQCEQNQLTKSMAHFKLLHFSCGIWCSRLSFLILHHLCYACLYLSSCAIVCLSLKTFHSIALSLYEFVIIYIYEILDTFNLAMEFWWIVNYFEDFQRIKYWTSNCQPFRKGFN